MKEDKAKRDGVGGPYMIQDHDHLGNSGQMGGESGQAGGQQSQQGQGDSKQRSGQHSAGQQGGEQSKRRSKLL
jgi:hypothetical protein